MQVYNALQRRNKLGLNLELSSAETGDAAELIAGLGPEGKFDAGYSDLSEMAGDVAGAPTRAPGQAGPARRSREAREKTAPGHRTRGQALGAAPRSHPD